MKKTLKTWDNDKRYSLSLQPPDTIALRGEKYPMYFTKG